MSGAKQLFWLSDTNSVHTRRWVTALSDEGYKVVVFGFADPEEDWSVGMPNVSLESGGFSPQFGRRSEAGWNKLTYVKSLKSIQQLAKLIRPQVVHAHYASSYGLISTLAGLRPRIVSVWGADVYSTPEKSILHRMVIRKVLGQADSVLSTSWAMRRRVLELVERDVDVTPFGIDVGRFSPPATTDHNYEGFTVGSIKTLESKYGMEYLIRGFASFRRARPSIAARLILVGSGSLMGPLKKIAEETGVGDDVDFVGSIEYSGIHSYHQLLDVAVYPSVEDSESFGVSVIESQACGVPAVVSRVGGLTEVVKEEETGLVVPPFDADAIAAAIERFYSDPVRRAEMGRAGRARVVANYSLQEAVHLLVAQYKKYGVA